MLMVPTERKPGLRGGSHKNQGPRCIFRLAERWVLPREILSLREGAPELRLEQANVCACAVDRFLSSATTLLSYKPRALETEIAVLSRSV